MNAHLSNLPTRLPSPVTCPQEDVSHHPGLFLRSGPGLQVHCVDGHRPGGQQAVPVRLPPLLLAGRRQGRPSSARQVGLQLSAAHQSTRGRRT